MRERERERAILASVTYLHSNSVILSCVLIVESIGDTLC